MLKESFTDQVKELMQSVRDNPVTVTVAVSANATGKTHAAARIAVWFFKAFVDSTRYTPGPRASGIPLEKASMG